MIPRFSNPHFIQQSIESVSRSDLFHVQENPEPDAEDLELQKTLDELIQSTLAPNVSVRAKKRRKLNTDAPVEAEPVSEPVLFRLLSTSHLISLLPRPPPPPVTREPECEDTAEVAETRRRQAECVAVDAAWVIQESLRLPPPFRAGRVERVEVQPSLVGSAPAVMVAHCLQMPRKTRPPVPRSQLQYYPYVSTAPLPPTPIVARKHFPSVEITALRAAPARKTRKRRRRKCRAVGASTIVRAEQWA
ncbi:hypothetical protein B0H10DRAFT_2072109 [Mycena sp. CBHHK59/15]|nr:hypothetical protein B0H10DRAFT_2072109 [Mycena sp. CBHHK59/15]